MKSNCKADCTVLSNILEGTALILQGLTKSRENFLLLVLILYWSVFTPGFHSEWTSWNFIVLFSTFHWLKTRGADFFSKTHRTFYIWIIAENLTSLPVKIAEKCCSTRGAKMAENEFWEVLGFSCFKIYPLVQWCTSRLEKRCAEIASIAFERILINTLF